MFKSDEVTPHGAHYHEFSAHNCLKNHQSEYYAGVRDDMSVTLPLRTVFFYSIHLLDTIVCTESIVTWQNNKIPYKYRNKLKRFSRESRKVLGELIFPPSNRINVV